MPDSAKISSVFVAVRLLQCAPCSFSVRKSSLMLCTAKGVDKKAVVSDDESTISCGICLQRQNDESSQDLTDIVHTERAHKQYLM